MQLNERISTAGGPVRPKAPRPRLRPLLTFFGVLGLAVAVAVIAGVLPRLAREKALLAASRADQDQLPAVNVAAARQAPSTSELDLPGDLMPLIESPIFARVDGYLQKRLVDVGDRVKAGQELADIETPELDQQLLQARAALSQSQSTLKELAAALRLSRANLNVAKLTTERWKNLEKRGVLSHQEADEKDATFEVRQAEVEAAQAKIATAQNQVAASEANVRRLEQMKAFARIAAPFDGIVTARNTSLDPGTLVTAGNAGPTKEMFYIAQIDPLRIFVNVPQAYVSAMHTGQTADLRVQELPGRLFPAIVQRTTHSLDANSRSMLVILQVPNSAGVLLPGMYAQIKFVTSRGGRPLLIPGDAVVTGSAGTRVAVVDADHRIHFRKIQVGQDFGTEMEVTSGLSAGDLVVMNPGDSIRENARVEVRAVPR